MPQMGGPENLESFAEADLYNEMLDVELTVHGFTATVAQLGPFCLKGNVSEMPTEARNNWLVDQINATGATIPAHVENTVAAITAARGLEHNYKVSEPTIEPALFNRVSDNASHIEHRPTLQKALIRPAAEESYHVTDLTEETAGVVKDGIPYEEIMQEIASDVEQSADIVSASYEVRGDETIVLSQVLAKVPRDLRSEPIAPTMQAPSEAPILLYEGTPQETHEPSYESVDEKLPILELPAPVQLDTLAIEEIDGNYVETPLAMEENITLQVEATESEMPPLRMIEQPPPSDALLEVISQPPAETLDRTIMAMNVFITASQERHAEYVAPIVLVVAERLQELDAEERNVVAPIMHDLMGAVHGLQVVIEKGGSEKMVEAVRVDVEVLCVQLFEALGVHYDNEDIVTLLETLLKPEFIVALQLVVDVEKIGTHEMKLFKQALHDTFSQAEDGLHVILGKLALLPHFKPLMVR